MTESKPSLTERLPKVYLPSSLRIQVYHLLPYEGASPNSRMASVCGACPWPNYWMGTGSQSEEEFLATLRLCRTCKRLVERSEEEDPAHHEVMEWHRRHIRVYLPHKEIIASHLVDMDLEESLVRGVPALCGVMPTRYPDLRWRGTGDEEEHAKARSLPLCGHCRTVAEALKDSTPTAEDLAKIERELGHDH
jgi:RNA polymerase subunit RPABC4/transcription elongation factor Spt4